MVKKPTLTEALERFGYTHRASDRTENTNKREVMWRGQVVFEGRCDEVWKWLAKKACAFHTCAGKPMAREGYRIGFCWKHHLHGIDSCSVDCCGIKGHPGECDE